MGQHLTETSLGRFLCEQIDPDIIAGQIVPALRRRYRPLKYPLILCDPEWTRRLTVVVRS